MANNIKIISKNFFMNFIFYGLTFNPVLPKYFLKINAKPSNVNNLTKRTVNKRN
ncbi:MAG: hypothetical protein Kow00127_03240 [Bacteroidales bacterium]